MPKLKKISSGKIHVDFAEPVEPTAVAVLWQLPVGALVTSVVVNYVTVPLDIVLEKLKRHDAAVKDNAAKESVRP